MDGLFRVGVAAVLVAMACGRAAGDAPRIVSCAPAATETIFDLGGEGCLVGRSSACLYPAAATNLPSVGAYSAPSIERIVALAPTHVLMTYLSDPSMSNRLERLGVRVLPWAGLTMVALQALTHLILRRGYAPAAVRGGQSEPRGRTMLAFLGDNPRFTVLLVGAALIFFGHNTCTNFLINVTRFAGGDESALGVLNGFMAAVEIPVMLFFGRIRGGRKSVSLLRLSLLFFALKALAIPLASSVPALFCVLVLQAPSFALYTAVIVDYVAETVPFEDSAKAQSLAYSMTTVGAVLASLVAGRLYDLLTVPQTLLVACAVTAIGVLLALLGTRER